jgi:hypothetical protein
MLSRSQIFTVIAVIVAVFPLSASAYGTNFQSHIEGDANRASDMPELNGSPHNLVVIRGNKDSALELWLGLEYVTTNAECRTQSIGHLMSGAPIVEQFVEDFVLVPAGQSNISVQFFSDRYLPGRCGWRPIGIDHVQFVPGLNTGSVARSGVAKIGADGKREIAVEWICQQKSYVLKGTGRLPLHLNCLAQNARGVGYPPISEDGAVIDMDIQLLPGVSSE